MAVLPGVTSRNKILRVIFSAGPATIWAILERATPQVDLMIDARALILAPWDDAALRQWIQDDSGLVDVDRAGRERIYEVTGTWSSLLRLFYSSPLY